MRIAGSYELPVEVPRAYEMLLDPTVLARALPGCDELVRIGPDEYEMRMKVAVASVQGLFSGKVRIRDKQPPESYRMEVDGTGKVGFIKGDGTVRLAPAAAGTALTYEGDVQAGGMIAAVGQRLLDTSAKLIIKKFFDKLSEQARAAPGGGA